MPVSHSLEDRAKDGMGSILEGRISIINLVHRATDSSSSAPSKMTCGPNACEKPTSSSTFTLPIILGVAHTRKQREEDANDRHASLDFGMGDVPNSGRGNKNHKVSKSLEEEKSELSRRQVSMDLSAINNPYLPSPGLQKSRKSLQSLSKSIENEGPYRPVPQYSGNDVPSLHILPKPSLSDLSTTPKFHEQSEVTTINSTLNSTLITHQNSDPLNNSQSELVPSSQAPYAIGPPPQVYLPNEPYPSQESWGIEPQSGPHLENQVPYEQIPHTIQASQSDYAYPIPQPPDGAYYQGGADNYAYHPNPSSIDREPTLPILAIDPPRFSSLEPQVSQERAQFSGEGQIVPQYSVPYNKENLMQQQKFSVAPPSDGLSNTRQNTRAFVPNRVSMGFRPLPPDNFTEIDDPEIRANRIRSFYKEYFDESAPVPAEKYAEDNKTSLGDDYGPYMPYPQNACRRAMTPPPAGIRQSPAHVRNGSHGAMSIVSNGRRRHQFFNESRPHSSASARIPPSFKKPFPPPAELNTLPIPSKLTDDAFALNPVDFAPISAYRATGRSEKMFVDRQPYTPVMGSQQELSPMPSPQVALP